MHHARPRLSVYSRLLLCQRVAAGRPVAHVATEMGVSRQTAYRWVRRFADEGPDGLQDRSCRPHRSPGQLPARLERRVLQMRDKQRRGPVWIADELGLNASTVGRVLARHRVPLLRDLDPTTGIPIRRRASDRRYEHDHPGALIHVDVKKLGRIPDGGGWRTHGRTIGNTRSRGVGYDYVHAAVDDHSRLAYAEILDDERGPTTAGFLLRATAFFTAHGITIERILSDNAWCYRHSNDVKAAVTAIGARHKFIRPHCPWTNGKVERFNRTLQTEWAYRRPFTSNQQRRRALQTWLRFYNTQRRHTAIGRVPPISRLTVNQVSGQYS